MAGMRPLAVFDRPADSARTIGRFALGFGRRFPCRGCALLVPRTGLDGGAAGWRVCQRKRKSVLDPAVLSWLSASFIHFRSVLHRSLLESRF